MRIIVVENLCECGCGQKSRGNYKTGHKPIQFCECNCGVLTTPGSKFVHGHDLKANHFSLPKGAKLSKEIIQIMKIAKRRSLHPDWTEEEIEFDILHENDKSLCLCGCGKNTKSRNSKFCAGHNHRGIPSWNKGLTKETNESIARMAEHQKGRIVSQEQREKQRQAITGRKHSEQTKQQMHLSHLGIGLGKKATAETRRKLVISHTGLKQTAEVVNRRMQNMGRHKFPYIFPDGTIRKMRSRWEVAYVKYLDSFGIKWQYEPKGFKLSTGKHYFPDFFLVELNEWHEIKGYFRFGEKEKMALFQKEYPDERLVIITNLALDELDEKCISYKKDGLESLCV